jgi:RNA polymerase sigma factor (sigma-70 family)
MSAEEAALVARLVARDPEAWRGFLDAYGPAIEGSCRRALLRAGAPADPQAVADASAETVALLFRDDLRLLKRYRSGHPLEAYLRVIARSRTLRLLKGRRGVSLSGAGPASGDLVQEAAEAAERALRVREALGRLPERDAEALRGFYGEGLTHAELAPRLGLSAGQVGMALSRAREKLRALLGKEFGDSG